MLQRRVVHSISNNTGNRDCCSQFSFVFTTVSLASPFVKSIHVLDDLPTIPLVELPVAADIAFYAALPSYQRQ